MSVDSAAAETAASEPRARRRGSARGHVAGRRGSPRARAPRDRGPPRGAGQSRELRARASAAGDGRLARTRATPPRRSSRKTISARSAAGTRRALWASACWSAAATRPCTPRRSPPARGRSGGSIFAAVRTATRASRASRRCARVWPRGLALWGVLPTPEDGSEPEGLDTLHFIAHLPPGAARDRRT